MQYESKNEKNSEKNPEIFRIYQECSIPKMIGNPENVRVSRKFSITEQENRKKPGSFLENFEKKD